MQCESAYVERISNNYNRAHAHLFGRKDAERRYLECWGLTLRSYPPKDIGCDEKRLSRSEEFCLFTALHFLKYRLKKSVAKSRERYLALYLALRNRAISANWLLVLDRVKKFTRQGSHGIDKCQLIEGGNLALIAAVDCFDPWVKVRLSTYACHSIHRSFYRHFRKRVHQIHVTEFINDLDYTEDDESDLWVDRLRVVLRSGCLTSQEQEVIERRFGCTGDPETSDTHASFTAFPKIAADWGMCKERVRQIQNSALRKIKHKLECDSFLH